MRGCWKNENKNIFSNCIANTAPLLLCKQEIFMSAGHLEMHTRPWWLFSWFDRVRLCKWLNLKRGNKTKFFLKKWKVIFHLKLAMFSLLFLFFMALTFFVYMRKGESKLHESSPGNTHNAKIIESLGFTVHNQNWGVFRRIFFKPVFGCDALKEKQHS